MFVLYTVTIELAILAFTAISTIPQITYHLQQDTVDTLYDNPISELYMCLIFALMMIHVPRHPAISCG